VRAPRAQAPVVAFQHHRLLAAPIERHAAAPMMRRGTIACACGAGVRAARVDPRAGAVTQSRRVSIPPSQIHEPLTRSRAFRWALAIGMLGVLCDVALLRASVPDLRDDIWEYAVAARHLLAGDGFRTSVVHPPLIGLLRPSDATAPILIHGPLMPLVLT